MTADSNEMDGDEGRRGDRRGNDRRRVERRAPPPWWRTPWALVGYGVLGAFLLVWTVSSIGGEDRPPPVAGTLETAAPAPARDVAPPPTPDARVGEAFGAAGFERMVVLGEQAVGKRVRTELFCESPRPVAARRLDPPEPAVEALMDPQGQVPAAECLWGAQSDPRREEFVLLVPPEMADEFAAAPLVNDNFIRRRRIRADVEWLGRSPALAVRIAGVLRGVNPPAAE